MLSSPETGVPVLKTRDGRWRRVLMPLLVVGAVGVLIVLVTAQGRGNSGSITGGGSTLAQPLLERAAVAYRDAASADRSDRLDSTGSDWVVDGGGIDYEATGSLGGILRLQQDQLDFAISDYPLSRDALTDVDANQFPIAVGSIAVVHNLDLPQGQALCLDAATLAGIYRGDITRWNDPTIVKLNPGLALPDEQITPVHRSDGSGSTHGFTGYLADGDRAWAQSPGTGPKVTWLGGVAAERSSGLISKVAATKGAIGYAEPRQAAEAGLKTAALHNAGGGFVTPTPDSVAAALDGATWDAKDNFTEPLALSRSTAAYPITVGIYAVLASGESDVNSRGLDFLSFIINTFDVSALGYVELPAQAKTVVREHLKSAFDFTP